MYLEALCMLSCTATSGTADVAVKQVEKMLTTNSDHGRLARAAAKLAR